MSKPATPPTNPSNLSGDISGHTHVDKTGAIHWCYHNCRSRWYVWFPLIFIFQVLMFPYEHQAAELLWGLPGLEWWADLTGVVEESHAE